MNSLNKISNSQYDIAYFDKEDFNKIPDDLEGSIAITVDKSTMTAVHHLVYYGQLLSSYLNGAPRQQTPLLKDKMALCHAMVVLQKEGDALLVIDADKEVKENRNGVCRSLYRIHYVADITGIVIIKPKSTAVREYNILNATLELTPHMEKQEIVAYDMMKAWQSCFAASDLYAPRCDIATTKRELATTLSHYIHFKNATDEEGRALRAICSVFATRVLQASVLMTALTNEDLTIYQKQSNNAVADRLFNRMNDKSDPIGDLVTHDPLFQLDHRWTLPYQLFDAIVGQKGQKLNSDLKEIITR